MHTGYGPPTGYASRLPAANCVTEGEDDHPKGCGWSWTGRRPITPGVSVTAAVLVAAGFAALVLHREVREVRRAAHLAQLADADSAYVDGYLDGVQRRKPRSPLGDSPLP